MYLRSRSRCAQNCAHSAVLERRELHLRSGERIWRTSQLNYVPRFAPVSTHHNLTHPVASGTAALHFDSYRNHGGHGVLHVTGTGARRKPDERTDLFSLGLVLYEMVAGQRAFAGETGAAVLDAILHREPAPVRQLIPQAPAALERIIAKALEKDRTRQVQGFGKFARSSTLRCTRRNCWCRGGLFPQRQRR